MAVPRSDAGTLSLATPSPKSRNHAGTAAVMMRVEAHADEVKAGQGGASVSGDGAVPSWSCQRQQSTQKNGLHYSTRMRQNRPRPLLRPPTKPATPDQVHAGTGSRPRKQNFPAHHTLQKELRNHSPPPRSTEFERVYDYDNDPFYDPPTSGSASSSSISAFSPRLPEPPRLSPISPRWDSLAYDKSAVVYEPPTTFSSSTIAPSPTAALAKQARSAVSPAASRFPGLSSHPVFPPDKVHREVAGPSSLPLLPGSAGIMVENFSRPRNKSLKQQTSLQDLPSSRQLPSNTGTKPESSMSPYAPVSKKNDTGFDSQTHSNASSTYGSAQRPRARGHSASSAKSSSTFVSLQYRPSNDHLGGSHRVPSRHAAQSAVNRPPFTSSSPSTNPQARDPPPWVASNDELRSSYRSQLTASTAQATLFTASGTERSSVLTKTSSVASASIMFGGPGLATDEGLSVEDVMGMYEKGFRDDDSSADEEDLDSGRRDAEDRKFGHFGDDDDTRDLDVGVLGGVFDGDDSRPPTSKSESAWIGARMLEAMSDSLPLPLPVLPSSSRFIVRDSAAIFGNSDLPGSLPKDVGFGSVIERSAASKRVFDRAVKETGKHDSKMVDAMESHPKRQSSTKARRLTTTPSRTPSPDGGSAEVKPGSPNPSAMLPLPRPPNYSVPAEPEEDPESRDRYGFRKANAYIIQAQYDTWNSGYTEYLARRRKKWIAYLKDHNLMTDSPDRFPPRGAKTKRFIRKGIPPDWRGAAWFYYAGGPGIVAKHAGVYDDLVRRAGLSGEPYDSANPRMGEVKEVDVEGIERDLHRTFPDNLSFKPPASLIPTPNDDSQLTLTSALDRPAVPGANTPHCHDRETPIITSLRRVLHAFALYNPRIGYCQSLNFLAGLLLLFVETEEQAFWLLNVITRVYLPGTHEMSLEGSKVDLGVLMAALKDNLPGVWSRIAGDDPDGMPGSSLPVDAKKGGLMRKSKRGRTAPGSKAHGAGAPKAGDPNRLPPITLCMTAWFMSCFIGTLPIESTLRVWDVFFYEGSRTLFRVALAVLKLGEPEIRAVADPMEMFGVVQALPRRMLDANALMEATFRRRGGFAHIGQDGVDEGRRERRAEIGKWKAEAARANNADGNGDSDPPKPSSDTAAGLDLAADLTDAEVTGGSMRRKGTLFGRRKDKDHNRERTRAAEV